MANKEIEQALLQQTTAGKSYQSYAAIAELFDSWALGGVASDSLVSPSRKLFRSYDVDVGYYHYHAPEELAALVLSLLQNHEDMRTVLDIGCGTGLTGKSFLERGYTVDGIDISERMLECVREKGIGYRNLWQHNVATMPLETPLRYDAAISVGVLGDYVPPESAARNFVHALQDRAVIGVAGQMPEQGIFGLQTILTKEGFQEAHFHVGVGYQRLSEAPREYAYCVFTRGIERTI
jgi:SAM-dependent methyltransferase